MENTRDVLSRTRSPARINIGNEVTKVTYNDNDIEKYSKSQQNARAVDNLADRLVEALNNPGARRFYCLVAMKLSEGTIWNNYELAMKGRNPQAYFTWLCKRSMND